MMAADFVAAALRNPVHDALLERISELQLPDAWIVAGCLTQTVWNALSDRQIDYGIDDYDIFYFDADLSWDAENRVINDFRACADRVDARVEIRNQARVHLWYPEKHGKPYPALSNATNGIDRFLTRCTQIGLSSNGRDVYAPEGLDDIRDFVVRPNRTPNFSPDAYRRKSARWQALWPELRIMPAGTYSDLHERSANDV
ncbi:nucleotidyltransferase family protein [Tardiphaga alba]|uniref:Nucleotidyltransferase family protein n=1 Tax=Tardiphaga alba TaxID=340268 RepID=A0ABX8A3Z4_9BRAD|nr:nucleotidyltransferase family protein [Tardiphaga alba]QUS37971.1 nucleotidyltransferase family protein [Tardiphaga alba]